MPPHDLDHLYQLPLAEFTKARDELAKQSESNRGAIRRLQKPNVPAWAVNQLYWRSRREYDALIGAAERARRAQVATLGGKSADVAKAEADHAAAKRAALDRIRTMLKEAGESATPATFRAIAETLDALPTADPPGRLTRPLKPMGFEGLAGLLKGKPIAQQSAQVLPFRAAVKSAGGTGESKHPDRKQSTEAASRQAAVLAKREAERQKAAARELASRIREAKVAEVAAARKLATARAEVEKAERQRDRLTEQLDAATQRLDRLKRQARELEQSAAAARSSREQLERA
jgi:hypothetical protein